MSKLGKKIILAYSGGLDTSCILLWLKEEGYQVIAYVANIGQEEDFNAVREKALKIGAIKVVIEDLKEVFLSSFAWPTVACGLIYENRYLLGTSIARPCISEGLIKIAKTEGASLIAHGATGKGNDQVRFELSCYSLCPEIQIVSPWREKKFYTRFAGRADLLQYAQENGIPVSATPKEPWSTDENLLHVSYESGILENPATSAPKGLYKMTTDPLNSPAEPAEIEIGFKQGYPLFVKDLKSQKMYTTPVELLQYLNKIGGLYGIGRIDIVENRFIGLKSRGIYESPGAKILYEAHQDLEIFLLDREVLRVKSYLATKMSDYVYNGLWFSPECDFVRNSILYSQKYVNGTVRLGLYKGNVSILGRHSEVLLYNKTLVSMDAQGGFEPEDAGGFIRTQAHRLKEFYRFKNQCDF
ncbi:argininosuccinate synthase [Nomia melanderi]|uniref:argininosuccinate synthase n=1 Tax=Nomia melanderi TaxID=2448451 RepID=UPI00130423E9|nr:argininosuccinate synthase [Nomia melanderi]